MRTARGLVLTGLLLVLGGCWSAAEPGSTFRRDLMLEPFVTDHRPMGSPFTMGSGDALGEWKQGRVEFLALVDLDGRRSLEAMMRDAASSVLEDYYAAEPATAEHLQRALER